jgi:hypothetical protein
MWAERYREPGEFEITAQLSSGLIDFLPLGSLISHADTYEVMMVENHEISETGDKDPEIKITGRSFDAYFEQRIVGMPQVMNSFTISEYYIGASYTWNQIMWLINDHIDNQTWTNDVLWNVNAHTDIVGDGIQEARTFKRGDMLKAVQELLAIDDLGIKTIRRSTFNPPGSKPNQTTFYIYRGEDKSASVIFSWKAGDIESAQYLWSDRKVKNAAVIVGRYINCAIGIGPIMYDRHTMVINADDIDGHLSAPPVGQELTDVIVKMQTRGYAILQSQTRLTITRTDLANVSKYQYRKDFNIGDLISVDGNFGAIAVMRVIEYVEIQDENGETGHPTLSIPGTEQATHRTAPHE